MPYYMIPDDSWPLSFHLWIHPVLPWEKHGYAAEWMQTQTGLISSFWAAHNYQVPVDKFASEPPLRGQERSHGVRADSRWNRILHWANTRGKLLQEKYAHNFSQTQMQWEADSSVIYWGRQTALINRWNLPPADTRLTANRLIGIQIGALTSKLAQFSCLLLSNFNALLKKPRF